MSHSSQHYTVNDDVYGKILKKPSPKKIQYDEVYEAVGGLGIQSLFFLMDILSTYLVFLSHA